MQELYTENAPVSDAPFSQGITTENLIFVSGQVPVSPETGEIVSDDIQEQTAQVLENMAAVLESAGSSMDDIVKTTVFITDIDDFAAVNEVYAEHMGDPLPARSAVEVSDLAIDIGVEIEAIAER